MNILRWFFREVLHEIRDVRTLIVQERFSLVTLHHKVDRMAASQQDVLTALQSENADLTALVSAFAALSADIDKLVSTSPADPGFDAIVSSIEANHKIVTDTIASIAAEDAKVNPPAPPASTGDGSTDDAGTGDAGASTGDAGASS